jgi:glucokinase
MKNELILAGDIGGTKTRLMVCNSDAGPNKPLAKKTYRSKDFNGLENIVQSFMSENDWQIKRACFGVAGPVKGTTAVITNLPWIVDSTTLQQETGIAEIILLNDIEAMAYAIPLLKQEHLKVISGGVEVEQGVKALIAPGTGLGVVFLTFQEGKYKAHRSEGGHTEFGPRNDLETDLLTYLRKKYEHVSYERVCSGMGLPNLYDFFRDTRRFEVSEEFEKALTSVTDRTPTIVNAALQNPEKHPICVAVVELFASILAAQAGNLALTVACHGGLYIGGGIPPRMIEFIQSERFVRSFKNKGRLSAMISDIPIRLITHSDIAITGAACHGLVDF